MSGFPFRFGVNEFTTQPWSFDEDVTRYAALGVDAIEICEAKLDPDRTPLQIRAACEAGLEISAVQPAIRTVFDSRMAPEPEGVAARMAAFATSLRRLAPLTPGASFVMNTGAHPTGNMHRAIEETARQMRALAPLASDLGVTLSIEPLNPTSMNVETAIWTIDQALDLLDEAGHAACGLCLDYWNIWQQPDCAAAIQRAGKKIFVVQASDWRTPLSAMDRLIPGEGGIPLGALLRATYAAGYRGVCTVEIFSGDVPDSLYDTDLSKVVAASRAGLEDAWDRAGT